MKSKPIADRFVAEAVAHFTDLLRHRDVPAGEFESQLESYLAKFPSRMRNAMRPALEAAVELERVALMLFGSKPARVSEVEDVPYVLSVEERRMFDPPDGDEAQARRQWAEILLR